MARYRARRSSDSSSDEPEDADVAAAAPITDASWAGSEDAPILARLQTAEIVACEQIPQGSNYGFVVGLSDAGTDIDLLAVYKPRRGEAPLWDFPDGTLYKREYAAYLAATAMGWRFVPPTVIREGPYGIGSVQLCIRARPRSYYQEWRRQHGDALMRVAVFDYVTNNADRKAAHCLLDEQDRVWAIDHGLTFNVDPKLRTVIREFSGDPLPDWLSAELQAFAGCDEARQGLNSRLRPLLHPTEIKAFATRLERVMKWRVFPRLDRYDSVPREWW